MIIDNIISKLKPFETRLVSFCLQLRSNVSHHNCISYIVTNGKTYKAVGTG